MKNLSFLNVFLMALAIFAISSCGSDDETIVLSPTISFVDEAGFISVDSPVTPGATFSVKIRADKGDNSLSSLTILQDGVNVTADRITIVDIPTANNPQLVTGDDTEGFTWEISIIAHSDELDSAYDFVIADGSGNSNTATVYINTIGAATPPTVSIDGPTEFTATANSTQIIKVNATVGSALLSSLAVYEDGVLIADLGRLDYWGTAFDANPLVLVDTDKDGLVSAEVTLRLGDAGAAYKFEVADENGMTAFADVLINTGTAVTEVTGRLLNQAGPTGTGGLDLDVNDGGVGSADPDAEIKDEGIDLSQPLDENWIQKISAANNAVLKSANGLPDGSGYNDITTQEEIAAAFGNASDLGGGISDVVAIGDEFIVERDGKYYFLIVTDMDVTADNNDDYYEFSVKQ